MKVVLIGTIVLPNGVYGMHDFVTDGPHVCGPGCLDGTHCTLIYSHPQNDYDGVLDQARAYPMIVAFGALRANEYPPFLETAWAKRTRPPAFFAGHVGWLLFWRYREPDQ